MKNGRYDFTIVSSESVKRQFDSYRKKHNRKGARREIARGNVDIFVKEGNDFKKLSRLEAYERYN